MPQHVANDHLTRASLALARPALLLLLTSCAGAAPARQTVVDRAFADIQVREARIDHSAATLADASVNCASVNAAAASARAAQRRLCEVAREVGDADALIRCERADVQVASQEATAHTRCPSAQETR